MGSCTFLFRRRGARVLLGSSGMTSPIWFFNSVTEPNTVAKPISPTNLNTLDTNEGSCPFFSWVLVGTESLLLACFCQASKCFGGLVWGGIGSCLSVPPSETSASGELSSSWLRRTGDRLKGRGDFVSNDGLPFDLNPTRGEGMFKASPLFCRIERTHNTSNELGIGRIIRH